MEIRRCYDHLISTVGFPIMVRRHLYIESGPRGFSTRAFLVRLSLEWIWNLEFCIEQQIKPPLLWCKHFSWIIPVMLARFPVRWHQPRLLLTSCQHPPHRHGYRIIPPTIIMAETASSGETPASEATAAERWVDPRWNFCNISVLNLIHPTSGLSVCSDLFLAAMAAKYMVPLYA